MSSERTMSNPSSIDSNGVMGTEEQQTSPQNESAAEEGSMDDDQKPNSSKANIRIASHDVAVQMLARLDDQLYQEALEKDANQINQNYLLPFSFPWRQGAHLPKKALKAMPRDIDELHAVSHCDSHLHAPFGDFQGFGGYGRFENGQSRGNYGIRPPPAFKAGSLSVACNANAAARRSEDPGVVELTVQMPLPSSLDSSMLTLTPSDWRERLIQRDADNAEALCHLPFSWNSKTKPAAARTRSPPKKTYGSQNESLTNAVVVGAVTPQAIQSSAKLNESKTRSRQQRDFAVACHRKWKISAKVEGVTTRTSLFPPSSVVGSCSHDNRKRQVIRPMLCNALLPEEVQAGQTVSMEQALELDKEGLSERLGSYDCRFTDGLLNQKKDSSSKTKRVVGRTRLVWSNLIQGDSTRNRVTYNSLITGRRVDPSNILRPREIKVGVRLKGKLIVEEAIEEVPEASTGNSKKRKHSTRQSTESDIIERRQSLQVSELRTDEEVDDAFAFSLDVSVETTLQDKQILEKSTENGAVVCLDMNSKSSPAFEIDHRDIITSLLNFNKYKRAKIGHTEAVSPFHSIKSYTSPRFAVLPVENEVSRTICVSSGRLPSSSVHEFLRDTSRADTSARCSVCFSNEVSGLLECSSCGLLTHDDCCLDKGQLIAITNVNPQLSKVTPDGHEVNNPSSQYKWQCAVCCQYSEKTKRNSRLPSRFTVDMVQDQSKQSFDSDMSGASKNVPGPRCALCPHRGGAMSLLEPRESQQWAHEVCRVWSNVDTPENKELETRPSHRNPKVSSTACALCGGSGVKRGKSTLYTGLTKCAVPGCYIAFHPMCALIASKMSMTDEQGPATPNHKTRLSIEQTNEEKKCDEEDDEDVAADKKLCNEFTLQLVKLAQTKDIIPVAFCGLHNASRKNSFYGCIPGGNCL